MNYQTEVYQDRLEAGIQYQDYVCMQLHRRGIVLQNMQSRKYQLKRENLLGLEIKCDQKLADTGNLYIETAEKADPARLYFVPSGIYRNDESWLYGIGNRNIFFIFGKKTLQRIYEHLKKAGAYPGCRIIKENETRTSSGFIMSKETAKKVAEKVVEFNELKLVQA